MTLEVAGGACRHVVQPGGRVKRALLEAEDSRKRPALAYRKQRDVVGRAVIVLDVLATRRLADHGEHLQGNVAVLQPRYIDLTACATRQQIAPPQQRVRVQIGDDERLMQRLGLVRSRIGRRVDDAVHRLFDAGRQHEEEKAEPDGEQHHQCRENELQEAPHHTPNRQSLSASLEALERFVFAQFRTQNRRAPLLKLLRQRSFPGKTGKSR